MRERTHGAGWVEVILFTLLTGLGWWVVFGYFTDHAELRDIQRRVGQLEGKQ